MKRTIWIGFDEREHDAFEVCVNSIRLHLSQEIEIFAVHLPTLRARGLYQRPTEIRDNQLWDNISGAPMSTEFAISRFLVPELAGKEGLAIFMDCDMLVRCDIAKLFELADERKAVQLVKHNYQPDDAKKMDGQANLAYPRKNWSSVVLWNLEHPANAALTPMKINTWTGRTLHNFSWLADNQIGAIDSGWNHLVGIDTPRPDARIAHFTLGVPSMLGYESCEFSDEWRALSPRYDQTIDAPCQAIN